MIVKGPKGSFEGSFFYTNTIFPFEVITFYSNICQKGQKRMKLVILLLIKQVFTFFGFTKGTYVFPRRHSRDVVYKRYICIRAMWFQKCPLSFARRHSRNVVSEVPIIIRVTSFPQCGFRTALIAYTCDVPAISILPRENFRDVDRGQVRQEVFARRGHRFSRDESPRNRIHFAEKSFPVVCGYIVPSLDRIQPGQI